MADEKQADGIPSVHTVFVRGARTTTSAHDAYYAKLDHEADERRKAEDARALAARQMPDQVKRHGMTLGGSQDHACIVLELRHPKDKSALDWIVCELLTQPKDDGGVELVLNLACPRCISHGLRMQNAQLKIHQSNRMFWLDEKKKGTLWVNPADQSECYTLAGEITMNEWCSCSRCGWNFIIDASIVRWR